MFSNFQWWTLRILSATEKQNGREGVREILCYRYEAITHHLYLVDQNQNKYPTSPTAANMPHDKNDTQIKRVHHHKIKEQNCGFSYEWINRKIYIYFSLLVDCNARVVGSPETPKLWVLRLCRLITPLYGLGLRSFQLQSCSPRWDLSDTMCVLISFCNAFSSSPWEMDRTSRSFYSWTKRKGRRYG